MVILKTASWTNVPKNGLSMPAGPFVIMSSGSGYSSMSFSDRPEIEISDGDARFKAWPRDCSIIYDATITLNMTNEKRGEIYEWLNRNAIKWSAVSDRTFKLYDQDSLVLFKMTWL